MSTTAVRNIGRSTRLVAFPPVPFVCTASPPLLTQLPDAKKCHIPSPFAPQESQWEKAALSLIILLAQPALHLTTWSKKMKLPPIWGGSQVVLSRQLQYPALSRVMTVVFFRERSKPFQ
jgi:hypothetical protein